MNSVFRTASKIAVVMNRQLFFTVLVFFVSWSIARADPAVESAQQKLKDAGFYYGEINGQKDADTIAAIRRYQIRNGLQINGELNAETLRSLGLSSKSASTPAPRLQNTPGPPPPDYPSPNPPPRPQTNNDYETTPEPPARPRLESSGIFGGTPYETAPPEVQQDIVARAQMMLMRQGYYRDAIDGLYGPVMNAALRNYQVRFGLEPSGRFDVETLASLSLLPEQRMTGPRRFHRRYWDPREPIYIPR